jgi:uncharacterized lipoprotein
MKKHIYLLIGLVLALLVSGCSSTGQPTPNGMGTPEVLSGNEVNLFSLGSLITVRIGETTITKSSDVHIATPNKNKD